MGLNWRLRTVLLDSGTFFRLKTSHNRRMGAAELRVRFQALVDGAEPFTSPLSIRVV